MSNRILFSLITVILFLAPASQAQMTPWLYWTFLPDSQVAEIIGEASGETAWNTIMETGGYNKDRLANEYATTFYESAYILEQLNRYGLPGAEIVRFPGGEVWDAVKGELWEISPKRQKIASYRDMTAMLVRGSNSADVKGELVWIGNGSNDEIDSSEVAGKIVVTEGNLRNAHNKACLGYGALGVVAISTSRPYFDPIQIPWSSLRSWWGGESDNSKNKFAFYLPVREGDFLKRRLLRGDKISVHAQVETKMEPYELQDVTCYIPGTDPNAGEIIFSAHLFEGIIKQGANDNKSGSAGILEAARVLHTLIEEGRLPRPKRTIRFIWGAEFSGIGPWVKANKGIMEKTLCNINMDMVGEWLSLNKAFMSVIRTSYGNPHYINDVMENYYRFVGEASREKIHIRSRGEKVAHRIVAPTGADEPFYYSIETHMGSSDHEVFNDWAVGVPGIMMIAWPDQWYHTSGDRVDKSDPTQMKRVVVIGAAAAYTIANADDEMAKKIASEITSNGTRRLGHQLVVGMEDLYKATAKTFNDAYKLAQNRIKAAVNNEKETLASVLELAKNQKDVKKYLLNLQKTIDKVGSAQLSALNNHVKMTTKRLKTKIVKLQKTDLERKASKMIPKRTAKVKVNGYLGFRESRKMFNDIPKEERDKFPYGRRNIASTRELQLLINGKNSILDIKNYLDVQYQRKSDLQSVLNYIEVLKLVGLVEM
ncbi:M28 family peptidase [candidate division KSB1 bacterium]|nr:M28 family peptidase [candidate division KSB1 bacterium]